MTIELPSHRAHAILAIVAERDRQDILKAQGRFQYTCTDLAITDKDRCLTILTEEIGEVARELCDWRGTARDVEHVRRLRDELTQVAAIALAWLEGLGD